MIIQPGHLFKQLKTIRMFCCECSCIFDAPWSNVPHAYCEGCGVLVLNKPSTDDEHNYLIDHYVKVEPDIAIDNSVITSDDGEYWSDDIFAKWARNEVF